MEVRNNSWLVDRLRPATPSFLLYSGKAGRESHNTPARSTKALNTRWIGGVVLSGRYDLCSRSSYSNVYSSAVH